jgi:hypothetical protein
MALWSIKPTWKKSIIERCYFYKDNNTFMVETGWRWGEFTCETEGDSEPDITSGTDLYNCDYDVEMVELNDGCWEETDTFGCDEETTQWLEEFLEENSYLDLEEHGWTQGDTEMILDCDPEFEKLED